MPKKSRRTKAKRRAAVAKAVQEGRLQQPNPAAAAVQAPAKTSATVQAERTQDSAGRYQHVIPELKRIGIIAGSIIVVLIILSFILG